MSWKECWNFLFNQPILFSQVKVQGNWKIVTWNFDWLPFCMQFYTNSSWVCNGELFCNSTEWYSYK
jgi:hypothetical protein